MSQSRIHGVRKSADEDCYVIKSSLDLVQKVLHGIGIRTEGRPGHTSHGLPGGSARVDGNAVLLDYVVLVASERGQDIGFDDLANVAKDVTPQYLSRSVILSTTCPTCRLSPISLKIICL